MTGLLKGLKNVTAFLTIIPVGMDLDGLRHAAEHIYFFPLIGALMGFLAGIFGWLTLHVLSPLITGMLVLGLLLLLSGFHHIDGLLDFGDGVMFQGSPTKKIKVMHDQKVGAGGFAIGLIVMLTTAFCIAELGATFIISALVISEVSAKFSMVVVAATGKSARKGMNTYFVNAMHDARGNHRFLLALILSLGLALLFLKIIGPIIGPITIGVGITSGLAMTAIAHRQFGGVTGDVFGATNGITRMMCIIVILVMLGWV